MNDFNDRSNLSAFYIDDLNANGPIFTEMENYKYDNLKGLGFILTWLQKS